MSDEKEMGSYSTKTSHWLVRDASSLRAACEKVAETPTKVLHSYDNEKSSFDVVKLEDKSVKLRRNVVRSVGIFCLDVPPPATHADGEAGKKSGEMSEATRQSRAEEARHSVVVIAYPSCVFIVDLLQPAWETDSIRTELNGFLDGILGDAALIKVSFGQHRWEALTRQWPAFPSLGNVKAFLDLQADERFTALCGYVSNNRVTLNRLCKEIFHLRWDGSVRRTSWSARPLSVAQCQFAANCGAVLLHMYFAVQLCTRYKANYRKQLGLCHNLQL
mmetsp:Transcript_18167/g.51241  ORF Transcript_18167/g.51241 Transcript_18167/m.51241 type:complete len:275 (-) Transcript_18167:171-995(-)|eukprot:CAMPEP_0119140632 /NCGR_PEP_ID=MMETSP1310-20130426/29591_1 /TAXON_ID=464262 /ORGANISM="Genus nov. species nov., Strain RCC2339" /LENGTH=274 /DNA_ID=CAMNT_0007132001 /DNA_START=78 /DNA_END=902 /DNA_ORIENTATION=+